MRMDNIFGMKARKANAHKVRNVEISVSQVLLREGNVHRCSSGKVSTMSMPRAHPGPLPALAGRGSWWWFQVAPGAVEGNRGLTQVRHIGDGSNFFRRSVWA